MTAKIDLCSRCIVNGKVSDGDRLANGCMGTAVQL